jgi:hypothetical protein
VEKRPVSARARARLVREAASAEAQGTAGAPEPPRPTRRTAVVAPDAQTSPAGVNDAPAAATRPPAGGATRARFVGAGAGLAVAVVIVLASRLPVFAPAPAASSRAEVESAPEALPAGPIALEAPSAAGATATPSAASIAAPGPSASPELALRSSPAAAASPGVRAAPTAMASAKVVMIGARGACDRYVAGACEIPSSNACILAKANRDGIERGAPAKVEATCRGMLDRDNAARARAQLDADNLAKSLACARYLGAGCAPHVTSLPGGSRLCIGVRGFAKARAAEGSAGEAACRAAEIGLPSVLQGLARQPEEGPREPLDMHHRFGIGQM